MSKHKTRRWLAALLCAVSYSGCTGTEIGNPQDSAVNLELVAYEAPPQGQALTLRNGVTLDEAWLAFDEIRLRPSASCNGETRVDLQGPIVVELRSGTERPALRLVRAAARYCRVELRLGRLREATGDAPAALVGASVLIRGRRADGIPFELRDDLSETLRVEGDFSLTAANEALVVGFDVGRWLLASSLDTAQVEGDRITIDREHNAALRDEIIGELRRAIDLYRDENRDGALQADELRDRLATGRTTM